MTSRQEPPSRRTERAMQESAIRRFCDYLGELGPRWGLPANSCRVHGYLYVVARPADLEEIGAATGLDAPELSEALGWLADCGLIEAGEGSWRTESDPWELLLRALEERRHREIEPAFALLQSCARDLQGREPESRTAAAQVGKLISLTQDLAAIDVQARRLSPRALRPMIGVGGRVSRFLDRAGHRGRGA